MRKIFYVVLTIFIFVALNDDSYSGQKSIDVLNNQLKEAIESKDPAKVEQALKNGANPNAVKMFGSFTPLLGAIYRKNVEIIKLLIAYGADVNRNDYNQVAFPLYYAALNFESKSGRDIIRILLQTSANPNKRLRGKDESSYEWLKNRCKLDDDCERFPEMKESVSTALKIFDEYMISKRNGSKKSHKKTKLNEGDRVCVKMWGSDRRNGFCGVIERISDRRCKIQITSIDCGSFGCNNDCCGLSARIGGTTGAQRGDYVWIDIGYVSKT